MNRLFLYNQSFKNNLQKKPNNDFLIYSKEPFFEITKFELTALFLIKQNYSLRCQEKELAGLILTLEVLLQHQTPVRRSTRIKRDEPKDEQLSNNVQELSSENEETQSKLSLPKKRTKPISPASKSTRAKKARNEFGKQQQIEEKKIDESPENASQESVTIKGKNKVIDQSYEDASTIEFKNQITEKLSTTPLNTISKHDSSDVNTDKSDPLVQAKWELIKAQLFEVPKEPRPAYREYQTKLFTKHPWMKKKDVDYLQKIFTDPKSMLAKKQLKTLFNFHIYNNFSDDQKKSSLETITEL
ncbi:hypothetical protein GLOIN_2v1520285 [Rhizophagus clarus]|uniref:Uncharacterized protein n=1 Tax=Rhizophagus clarus TaxID=94130 RepID=A0A8H3MFU3_9GLOM|nr:hypothetical protein GLOIN_2v1520285 [Rhizophagus clarus]